MHHTEVEMGMEPSLDFFSPFLNVWNLLKLNGPFEPPPLLIFGNDEKFVLIVLEKSVNSCTFGNDSSWSALAPPQKNLQKDAKVKKT